MSRNNPIRLVKKEEVFSLAEWAIPRYIETYPRVKLETLLPLIYEAVADPTTYRLARTDNAVGLFVIEKAPWEPLPTICDIFVVGRPKTFSAPFEVCRLYNYGLELAIKMKAAAFRYGTDGISNKVMAAIAKRIGFDRVSVNYVKVLDVGGLD